MRLEKVKSEFSSVNIESAHSNGASACDGCVKNENGANYVTPAIDELIRITDQATTAISDTFNNEVRNCPAGQ